MGQGALVHPGLLHSPLLGASLPCRLEETLDPEAGKAYAVSVTGCWRPGSSGLYHLPWLRALLVLLGLQGYTDAKFSRRRPLHVLR